MYKLLTVIIFYGLMSQSAMAAEVVNENVQGVKEQGKLVLAENSTVESNSTVNTSQKLAGKMPFSANQKWAGHYTCTQGETSLTLHITAVSSQLVKAELGDAYDLEAIFDFDFKNRTAAGAFTLTGKYYPETHKAIFSPGKWIRNPNDFTSAGMDGVVSASGTKYSGKILDSRCSQFELDLTDQ